MNINQRRSAAMEKANALAMVLSGRADLEYAKNRLASAELNLAARPRTPTLSRDMIRNHIEDIVSKLAKAESHCLEVNPEGLLEHDAAIVAAERAASEAREAEEASGEIARQEALARSEAAALARLESRKRVS